MPQFAMEQEIIFFDSQTKNDILLKSYPKIKSDLAEILSNGIYENKKEARAFGAVFEDIAITERIESGVETETQKGVRKILEEAFKKANQVTGRKTPPSTPDYVSVSFDNKGELIIDEIIDMKTSKKALERGQEKGQPQKTIDTMQEIISIFNDIIAGKSIDDMKSHDILKPHEIDRRTKLLSSIKKQLTSLDINEKISFSDNLTYILMLPSGEWEKNKIFTPKVQLSINGIKVESKIITSEFSKKNIHAIIDHYSETP